MLLPFAPSPSIIPLFIFIFLLYRLRQCCSHLNLLCTALDSSVLDETDLSLAMSAISLTHLNQDSIVRLLYVTYNMKFYKRALSTEIHMYMYTFLLYIHVHVCITLTCRDPFHTCIPFCYMYMYTILLYVVHITEWYTCTCNRMVHMYILCTCIPFCYMYMHMYIYIHVHVCITLTCRDPFHTCIPFCYTCMYMY